MSILLLQPIQLWKHFLDICSIPHPSKHEEAICKHIIQFAESNTLQYTQDSVGNIVIYKQATKGCESKATVCLQAHVDMVPQKNTATIHNFETDSIKPRIVGEVVKATNTTLGADNGIGLAAILAILESKTIEHGPIEALFTIDEETGMTGAKFLDPTLLHAKYMINTDSEIENEITIGCAGGIDANFIFPIEFEQTPPNSVAYTISISGLNGGHSGFEIHLGRANANCIMAQYLLDISTHFNAQLCNIHGGNMRNAIPREATATITVSNTIKNNFEEFTNQFFTTKQLLHSLTDPKFTYTINQILTPTKNIAPIQFHYIIQAVTQCPQGVIRFEKNNIKIVRTSTNLSIISTHENQIEVNCLLRSVSEDEKQTLVQTMKQLYTIYGASCMFAGDYPGWKPIWDSPINLIVAKALEQVYSAKPKIEVVHAGLECGIFSSKYPNIEYISFGPTIRNPHSPDEEVDIASVERFWNALIMVLKSIT